MIKLSAVYIVAGLLFGPVWWALAERIGKHRALAASAATMVAGELAVMVIPFPSVGVAMAVIAFAGISYSGSLLLRSMIGLRGRLRAPTVHRLDHA